MQPEKDAENISEEKLAGTNSVQYELHKNLRRQNNICQQWNKYLILLTWIFIVYWIWNG